MRGSFYSDYCKLVCILSFIGLINHCAFHLLISRDDYETTENLYSRRASVYISTKIELTDRSKHTYTLVKIQVGRVLGKLSGGALHRAAHVRK